MLSGQVVDSDSCVCKVLENREHHKYPKKIEIPAAEPFEEEEEIRRHCCGDQFDIKISQWDTKVNPRGPSCAIASAPHYFCLDIVEDQRAKLVFLLQFSDLVQLFVVESQTSENWQVLYFDSSHCPDRGLEHEWLCALRARLVRVSRVTIVFISDSVLNRQSGLAFDPSRIFDYVVIDRVREG